MINDLDQTIRQILLAEGQLDPGEIEVSFDLPNREWSARISKPTINCYLFDIRENLELREQGWKTERGAGSDIARRQAQRNFSLTYLVTAWTREVADEHHLLWHTLHTLARFPVLPAAHLKGRLAEQAELGASLITAVARPGGVLSSPGEFWTSLENHLKPSLSYVITLPLERDPVPAGPPVFSTRLRVGQPGVPPDELEWIGGVVCGAAGQPCAGALVQVEGRPPQSFTDQAGRFRLRGLPPGEHALLITLAGLTERHPIAIPSNDYTILLEGR